MQAKAWCDELVPWEGIVAKEAPTLKNDLSME